MRLIQRTIAVSFCALALIGCADDGADDELEVVEQPAAETPAPAPADSELAQYAGTWEAVAILDSGDTVSYTLVATEDRTGWTVTFPDREPMELRVLSVDEDGVVTEVGPYESLLREGVQVTVRQESRFEDGRLVGTLEAHYAGEGEEDDVTVEGTTEATRVD